MPIKPLIAGQGWTPKAKDERGKVRKNRKICRGKHMLRERHSEGPPPGKMWQRIQELERRVRELELVLESWEGNR